MSNLEDFRICPYNRSHILRQQNLAKHIFLCRTRYQNFRLPTCTFNTTCLSKEDKAFYKGIKPVSITANLIPSKEDCTSQDVGQKRNNKCSKKPQGPTSSSNITSEVKTLDENDTKANDSLGNAVVESPSQEQPEGEFSITNPGKNVESNMNPSTTGKLRKKPKKDKKSSKNPKGIEESNKEPKNPEETDESSKEPKETQNSSKKQRRRERKKKQRQARKSKPVVLRKSDADSDESDAIPEICTELNTWVKDGKALKKKPWKPQKLLLQQRKIAEWKLDPIESRETRLWTLKPAETTFWAYEGNNEELTLKRIKIRSQESDTDPDETEGLNQNPGANADLNQNPGANADLNQNPGANADLNQNPGANADLNQNPGANADLNQNPGANGESIESQNIPSQRPCQQNFIAQPSKEVSSQSSELEKENLGTHAGCNIVEHPPADGSIKEQENAMKSYSAVQSNEVMETSTINNSIFEEYQQERHMPIIASGEHWVVPHKYYLEQLNSMFIDEALERQWDPTEDDVKYYIVVPKERCSLDKEKDGVNLERAVLQQRTEPESQRSLSDQRTFPLPPVENGANGEHVSELKNQKDRNSPIEENKNEQGGNSIIEGDEHEQDGSSSTDKDGENSESSAGGRRLDLISSPLNVLKTFLNSKKR